MGQDCSSLNCMKDEPQSEFNLVRETGTSLKPLNRDGSYKPQQVPTFGEMPITGGNVGFV